MGLPLLQLEELDYADGRSFRIMKNVKLSDFYFWHFHPEIELVYINASKGLRQVGIHSEEYTDGDLVLIGSGIPHLNFDYQLIEEYDIIVIHLLSDFLKYEKVSYELQPIVDLIRKSKYGLSFSPSIKHRIGQLMFKVAEKEGFAQYLGVLNILNLLSEDDGAYTLHDHPYENQPIWKEQFRLKDLYQHIDENYMNEISLSEAAEICHLSKEAFCRYFKKATKTTFVTFLNRYRIAQAKRMILSNEPISRVAYKCGFENLAYFSRVFRKVTGESPTGFRNRVAPMN